MSKEPQEQKSNSVQSIDRVFLIIEELSCYSRGLRLSELADKLDLHASTVHRLLNTLVVHGYVQKDTNTGKYRLTLRMFEIGSRIIGGSNIVSLTKPHLDRLADLTGEAVHLVVPEGDEVIYLYKCDAATNMVRMGSTVGLHNPMYCTGVGKAILSCWSDEDVAALWTRAHIVKYTDNTIIDYEKMHQELEVIRRQHYSIDNEEHENGIKCIATPIVDIHNSPIAAISISAMSNRLGEAEISRYAPLLLTAASEISTLLGNHTRVYQ